VLADAGLHLPQGVREHLEDSREGACGAVTVSYPDNACFYTE
jgi:hypothetical protein